MNKIITRSLSSHSLLPSFYVNAADQIRLLHEPQQFHSYLVDSIDKAQNRIFISALYIGKEETDFISRLHNALVTRPNLQLHILLDGLRSTREYPSTTAASLISTLQSNFPHQIFAYFYHTPDLVGLRKKIVPRRFDEGWGLWHAKIFGFDDTVVMSGANLSRDYFTNRQDRYWVFHKNRELADFMHGLIKKCSQFSMRLNSSNNTLYWPSSSSSSSSSSIPSPLDNPKQFRIRAYESLSYFLQQQISLLNSKNDKMEKENDTLIRPFIQMGPLGIRQEFNIVVPAMINAASNLSSISSCSSKDKATLDWTSGYFSLDRVYKHLLINKSSPSNIRVLCASPTANGFLNSKGISKYIPPAYTFLEHQFWKEFQKCKKQQQLSSNLKSDLIRPSLNLREWSRPGWTYHAKGLWVTPPPGKMPLSHSDIEAALWMPRNEYQQRSPTQPSTTNAISPSKNSNPVATVIGSSNYGPRSTTRDMEINFLITTICPNLQQSLSNELRNLNQNQWTELVDRDVFLRKDRVVPVGVKFASWLIRDML